MRNLIDNYKMFIQDAIIAGTKVEYHIAEIAEPEVPLASGMVSYYWLAVVVVVGVVCLLAILIYLLSCNKYRKRIYMLTRGEDIHVGWNFFKLRARVEELEEKKINLLLEKIE